MSDDKRARADASVSRRTALGGAATLGAAALAGAAPAGATPTAFNGSIGATFAQSRPAFATEHKPPASAPNIVVIVLDDVGFSDLSCYGGDIGTPAMDALAAGGLRYTNFRTTGVCSATRASLYTGLNPHSAGIGWLTFSDDGFPGYRGDLSPAAVTMAEALSAYGYGAYHCGKWHVNSDASISAVGPFKNWPLQRGYQRAHWFQGHSTDYFRPSNMFDGNQRIEIESDTYFATDDITDHAALYISEHVAQAPARPFFLTVAYSAAHSPLHAPAADIAAQRGRFERGWDQVRSSRLARQIELGIVPANTRMPPRNPGVVAWDSLSEPQRRLYQRYMEVYAAVIARVDASIGRLVDTLRQVGALENTMIVLLSDNGGSPDGGVSGTPNLLAGIGGGVSFEETLAQLDTLGGPNAYAMYPAGWAMASNTPFRLYKHDTHLGGVADPLIVHWPAGIAARGELRRQYVHVCDVYPTLLAAARAPIVGSRAGVTARPIQGKDFGSTFARPDAAETRREQHFEMNGTRAFYADGWRLVSKGHFGQPGDGWELFNLADDCNEIDDVAAANPARVSALERRWVEAAHRYDVFPIDTRPVPVKSLSPLFRGGGRSRWEYFPPVDLVMEEAAPPLIGRAHQIEIELAAPLRTQDHGVLYAFGNAFLGHVLYLRNGALVHEITCKPRILRTECPAPIGASRIVVAHALTARPWRGSMTLTADERTLVTKDYDRLVFGMVMQGLQIGRNGGVPVSDAYARPFAFTGAIRHVKFDLDTTPYSREEIQAAFGAPH